LPRSEWDPLTTAFCESATGRGFAEQKDFDGTDASGAGAVPRNDAGGVRLSSAIGYLNPARARTNLTVCGDSTVCRLLVRRGRAHAVEVASGGESEVVEGDEIVLCAGALATLGPWVRRRRRGA
jgi:choline dehydrogenase